METRIIKQMSDFVEPVSRKDFSNFLFVHLQPYGDPINDIEECIDYALLENVLAGGFIIAVIDREKIVGGLIVNHTGMKGYIPENIIVYVAVDSNMRGKGIGKMMIEKAISMCDGDIKLHVEYENPAKRLYERIGFKNKYAEMRFKKN
ncbi:MAG: GNAT family N-acetyltransferase [Bacteroidetes bacterium GWF2_43_63]|nr:MAG: GNAT family N-acetyltransferase [Bacteroidetes bacterium GWE2_42_42]OFY56222.1 MAG: GNAT family N-acetyltransferase [Bacteroidetes bacterium GWF2_43_63]HBG71893.1 GNAT family N-acetyltransferase [Bacteroidales bacterium]HCB61794.1 GNAT family N-acetyltransferase [Bacteroidales bacterium]HCY23816.1 GNAT family N-acetyltransferase [Bacteroidales bacterium]